MCARHNISASKINPDVEHRWNSMYDFLNKAIERKINLNEYCDFHTQEFMMTEAHWELCAQRRDLLQVFYAATLFFSGVSYPTSNGALHSHFEISLQFEKCRDHDLLRSHLVTKSLGKFFLVSLKLW